MPRRLRTLLCPTDLSPGGDAAVAVALALAEDGGTVHLLHVLEPVFVPVGDLGAAAAGPPPADDVAWLTREARGHLASLVGREPARNVRTELHVVHAPYAAGTIVDEALRLAADAIVMGSHGQSDARRALVGSVSGVVTRTSTLPVLVFRGGVEGA